jgi:hypothetical protein
LVHDTLAIRAQSLTQQLFDDATLQRIAQHQENPYSRLLQLWQTMPNL